MKRHTIVDVTPPNATYYPQINPHIYPDKAGLLLMATIETDGAMDEVGATIVVEAERGRSVSSRCL